MKITGAELVVKLLEKQGVEIIAGIPGGTNLPLYDALSTSSIKHILARHEQGAGFIAQGIARSTGKAGVCLSTSGPGATNLVTAIADAHMDSVPVIAITGQISSSMIGTDAFQEVDIYGMTIPVTKHNFLIKDAFELIKIIPESFKIATDGRPGPVLIDIPKDIQTAILEIPDDLFETQIPSRETEVIIPEVKKIHEAAEMINRSKKPVIIAGGGIVNSETADFLYQLSTKNTIPVALSLMALGCFSPDSELYLGMPGMHGSRHTNRILHEADLIIALGMRFDDRLTGNPDGFCRNASILQIDIDKSEFNKIKTSDFYLHGDLKEIIKMLLPHIEKNRRTEWKDKIYISRKQNPNLVSADTFSPYSMISQINNLADSDAIITTDVGQHQMWTAQYYKFTKPRTLLTSGGLGTMGFGLPAAIGAALACPDKQVICFSGDGSFLMNIQELALLAELDLNIKIFIFNNKSLGLVRQQQELFYNSNFFASKFEYNPEFSKIAEAFGIEGIDLSAEKDITSTLKNIFKKKNPVLTVIPISQHENVFPIVPPGKTNNEMIGGYYEKINS